MIRKEYLNKEYTKEDKKLIALFQKQLRKINQVFNDSLLEKDKTKALVELRKMQAINKTLKIEYGERAEVRIPEEYLNGALYIDDTINNASSLSRIKFGEDKKKIIMSRIAQLGFVHTEAVKALIDSSKILVSASIDGMEKVAINMLTKHQQAQTRVQLAEGIIRGDGLEKMKKNIEKMFNTSGVAKFKDRAGRLRDMNRYVDMLTRTETKIANTQGTINRALENGITKFEVVEHDDCCDICKKHNGKVYDISKGTVDLPPYHPNCRGYIIAVIDVPESRFGLSIDLKAKSLAAKAGIDGKNTLERMKKLNKYIKTPEGRGIKKEVYKIKNKIIFEEGIKKGKTIPDKGINTTIPIQQKDVKVNWHIIGKNYNILKKKGIIK